MKSLAALFVIFAMTLGFAFAPAAAGYDNQWAKFRTQTMDKADSRALCPMLMPWPWKCSSDIDSDGDGVMDGRDKCPGTPAGATVDRNGCPMDSDKDGVYDGIDRCPDTPAGVKVDSRGCPMDSDKDGVLDGADKCPDTPLGATVNADGCPTDSDGDGVYDGIDKCPNTPARAKVDSRGCPMDSDGDGVYDGIDKCPNTPKDTKVDESGCPAVVKQFIDTGKITTSEILFDTDKATLKPESKRVLDEIGAILIQVPDLKIEIGGQCDYQGSDDYNLKLSDERAKAVRDYFVKNFPQIRGENLVSKGYGESTPVATNETAAGRAQNRRVEFTILR